MATHYDEWLEEQRAQQLALPSFPTPEQSVPTSTSHAHGHVPEIYQGIVLGHAHQYPHPHATEKTGKIVVKTLFVLLVFASLALLMAFVDVWAPSGGSVVRVIIAWLMGILAFFALIGIWFVRSWMPRIILGFIFGMGMYLLWWFVFWHTLVH